MQRISEICRSLLSTRTWLLCLLLLAHGTTIAHELEAEHAGDEPECSICIAIDRLDDCVSAHDVSGSGDKWFTASHSLRSEYLTAAELPTAASRGPPAPV